MALVQKVRVVFFVDGLSRSPAVVKAHERAAAERRLPLVDKGGAGRKTLV